MAVNLLLAMDSVGPSLSVAIAKGGEIVYEAFQRTGLTHSQRLLPLIDDVLVSLGIEVAQLDALAVTVGPGSFTGVRIGVETAKALAHALEIPCVPVNALEAIAYGARFFGGPVCPLQDARAGQVYCAVYRSGECILPDSALKLDDFLAALPQEPCCFLGDGALKHREAIAARLGARACFAPPSDINLRAAAVASLALLRPETALPWHGVMPYYLRKPQAEREREAREAAHA